MKKIVLSVAVVLASLSIYATTTLQSEIMKSEVTIQAEYTEISADAVPAAVKTALETAYPGAKLVKAYINDKKEYKLEISVKDQKATVFSDVNGNWLKI
ncbi:PepSY-like domain-containing protein [Flavobacterium sp. N1736]|uniref:PepSY-like domain-containing protein n=1 Tax=Flavobacterium sp. N1736 TaxID=2986823 RepID=UPI0022240DF9|nr:PepSY-like domain-containing protein [Flavobacterium sp. N1736]